MPWLIQHKCNIAQSGFSDYAIIKATRDGNLVTRVMCPNHDCREEFMVIGHEMFTEAEQTSQLSVSPGILIPVSRRAG